MHDSEKLEIIKQSLNNSEELADIKNNPVVKATIISVIKSVPILGELVDSSMDICLTTFQENKRNELIKMILSDAYITSDMVNDVEFILNFAKTLEAVNRLASNDKIRYFANLIKNGYFTSDKIENDLFEEYLRLLSTLSYREIEYLYFIYKYQSEYFGKVKKKGEYTHNFGLAFSQSFNCGEFDYIDVYDKLAATGCIQKFYIGYASQIKRVQDGYYEDYQMSDIEVDVDYYYINENFIQFIQTVTKSDDEES